MKYIKILGLATSTALALAFLGASGASATVLCKTNLQSGCGQWDYPAGTEIHLSQETGSSLVLTNTSGSTEKTCIDSTTKGSTQNTGGVSSTVVITITVKAFGGCTNTVDTLELGQLEVHHIAGTVNGTLTGKGFRWTTNLAGISCVYGYGTGVDLGILTGGSMATADYDAVVPKREGSFLCPGTTVLDAIHTVTSPEPLYVSES